MVKTSKTVEDMFKIGRSKKFINRLMSHNSIEPYDIEIIMLYETNSIEQVEICVKNALKSKQYRKRKEIYQVDIDVVKDVIENCDDIINKVKKSKTTKNKKFKKNFLCYLLKKRRT